jgi:hypothetical protein
MPATGGEMGLRIHLLQIVRQIVRRIASAFAGIGHARIGNARIGNARIGNARIGNARIGNAP